MNCDHREVLALRACWVSGARARASSSGDGATIRTGRRLYDWRKRKRKRKHHGYEYEVLIFHNYFPFIVLALRELSWVGIHFRPFTEVVRKIRREVTRKAWIFSVKKTGTRFCRVPVRLFVRLRDPHK